MTEAAMSSAGMQTATSSKRDFGLKRRHAAEARFRFYGIAAITIGLAFLCLLLFSIVPKGYTAFVQTAITVPVEFTTEIIDKDNVRATDPRKLLTANYPVIARNAVARALGIDLGDKAKMKELTGLVSEGSRAQLRDIVSGDPSVIGTTRDVTPLAAADIDSANKGQIDLSTPEAKRKVSDLQVAWLNQLKADGHLSTPFNWGLISFGASSRPETAGLGVAIIGSFYMMLVVLLCSSDRRRRLDLPRRVRQEEPLHRPDRGQHQQSCRRALDRVWPLGWLCSLTSSACRVRLRWLVALFSP